MYAEYDNDTEEKISTDKLEISGYDKNKLGEQELVIKYEGKETKLKVTVERKPYFETDEYVTQDGYIINIGPNTNLDEFRKNIDTNMEYEVLDKKNNKIIASDALIGTGMKLKLKNGNTYTIVITGDLTGDGIMDVADLSVMATYVVGKANLENEYLLAGNLNNDKLVDIADLSIIANLITK